MKVTTYTKNSKSIYVALVRFVAAVCFFASIPASLNGVDFRGMSSSIVFKTYKMAPPFAALEDARQLDEMEPEEDLFGDDFSNVSKDDIGLIAGNKIDSKFIEKLNEKIEPVLVAKSKSQLLKGLRIKADGQKDDSQDRKLASKSAVVIVDNVKNEPVLVGSNGRLAPLSVRKEKILASIDPNSLSASITVDEKAKSLVNEALLAQEVNPKVKEIKTASGGSIIIKKAIEAKDPTKIANSLRPVDQISESSEPQFENRTIEDGDINGADLSYVITGQMEMTGGLAYTGVDTFLRVVQIYGGYVQNEGVIWPMEGRYEIVVDRLEGYLVAELRASSGEVLGYGEADLGPQIILNKKNSTIRDIGLLLKPAPKGLMVNVTSARSFADTNIEVKNAKVVIDSLEREVVPNKKGQYSDPSLESSSSLIVRAEKKGYWGGIAISEASTPQEITLYPQSMVEALISLNVKESEVEEVNKYGVVWGKVVNSGKPLAGAVVEMAGEGFVGPIYFTGYIPDKRRRSTSENGLYAFIKVAPGIQSVRATYRGYSFPSEIFPVEARHVSHIEIKAIKKRKASIKMYDGLSQDLSLGGMISVIGSKSEIRIKQGRVNEVQLPGGKGVMIVEADAGEPYDVIRVTTNKNAQHIDFPMVQRHWLNKKAEEAGIKLNPDLGLIVGFNSGEERDVFLNQGHLESGAKILYFDRMGKSSSVSTVEEGGGFIIYNVPPGYKTLTSVTKVSGATQTQVVIAAPGVVNVTKYHN